MAQQIMKLSPTDNAVIKFLHQQYASEQAYANRLFESAEKRGSAYLEDSAQRHQDRADELWEKLDEMGAFS